MLFVGFIEENNNFQLTCFSFLSQPTIAQWQIVFFIAAFIYIGCATFYNFFASGERQPWDNPDNDDIVQSPSANGHQNSVPITNIVTESRH